METDEIEIIQFNSDYHLWIINERLTHLYKIIFLAFFMFFPALIALLAVELPNGFAIFAMIILLITSFGFIMNYISKIGGHKVLVENDIKSLIIVKGFLSKYEVVEEFALDSTFSISSSTRSSGSGSEAAYWTVVHFKSDKLSYDFDTSKHYSNPEIYVNELKFKINRFINMDSN